MNLDLKLKDINGVNLKLGDTVQVIKITDDSGNACDLYGVESHLNGWVDITYLEIFEGEIIYDELRMMIMIKGKHRNLPLSPEIRYDIWNEIFDRIKVDDVKELATELNIGIDYENIIDYIKKIK